jgi:hypothetical protein
MIDSLGLVDARHICTHVGLRMTVPCKPKTICEIVCASFSQPYGLSCMSRRGTSLAERKRFRCPVTWAAVTVTCLKQHLGRSIGLGMQVRSQKLV